MTNEQILEAQSLLGQEMSELQGRITAVKDTIESIHEENHAKRMLIAQHSAMSTYFNILYMRYREMGEILDGRGTRRN